MRSRTSAHFGKRGYDTFPGLEIQVRVVNVLYFVDVAYRRILENWSVVLVRSRPASLPACQLGRSSDYTAEQKRKCFLVCVSFTHTFTKCFLFLKKSFCVRAQIKFIIKTKIKATCTVMLKPFFSCLIL